MRSVLNSHGLFDRPLFLPSKLFELRMFMKVLLIFILPVKTRMCITVQRKDSSPTPFLRECTDVVFLRTLNQQVRPSIFLFLIIEKNRRNNRVFSIYEMLLP